MTLGFVAEDAEDAEVNMTLERALERDRSFELNSNSVGPGALAGAAPDTAKSFTAAGALARAKRKLS